MSVVDASTLTAAEIVALLEGESLYIDAGLELLDSDDVLIEDISADLIPEGSSIERGIYRTVHATCSLRIARELQWGWQRVRPYLLVSADNDTFYRWNLGVFLLSTPQAQVGEEPRVYQVDGFDKLDVLNTPYGSSYSLAASANVVDAVTAIITAAGETRVSIEPSTEVSSSARVMSIVDDWTTLQICNELLNSIGHRSLYVDRDGIYRSEPYRAPGDMPTVWTYSADSATSTVTQDRSTEADFHQAANVVVVISDAIDATVPSEGAGMVTVENAADGPTSIEGRGGRVIRRVERGTYATQAAIVTAANRLLNNEKRVASYVDIGASANPVHGHYDVVRYIDSAVSLDARFLVTNWTLPLDGSDMALSLRGV